MTTPLFLQALNNQNPVRPPLWLMRQAGRYLPEYRAVRARFPDFITFCLTPDAATEVTLQPITRFGLDAAIIFADILTIPDALGHKVTFSAGHGPHVEKLSHPAQVAAMAEKLDNIPHHLAPVAQTVRHTRAALDATKAVIGFSGAPWTLASYLFDNKPSHGTPNLLAFEAAHPQAFQNLIQTLTQACIAYLNMQIQAGANAVQLFDSWAAACPQHLWHSAVHQPLLDITAALKANHPHIPVILFPRLAPPEHLLSLTRQMPDGTGVSLATEADWQWATTHLPAHVALQGNLPPQLMTQPSSIALESALTQWWSAVQSSGRRNVVLNLGHGLTPETQPERVADLARMVQALRYEA